MCHHTLTSFSSATRRTPNVLSTACSTRIAPNSAMVLTGVAGSPNCSSSSAFRKDAAPKSIPAVTATWPRKLNQPVNHDHAGPFDGASFAAQ
jgi:hypothetical protein